MSILFRVAGATVIALAIQLIASGTVLASQGFVAAGFPENPSLIPTNSDKPTVQLKGYEPPESEPPERTQGSGTR